VELTAKRGALESVRELKRRAAHAARRFRSGESGCLPNEAELLRAFGGRYGSIGEALRDLGGRGSALLAPGLRRSDVQAFYGGEPQLRARLLTAADEVLAHRFDLLGSGPRHLGDRLPWHADFKSGHVWSRERRSEELMPEIAAEFGRGRDVKVPWELSRFQHAPLLGQAFLATGDARYALEFQAQVGDWIDANPIGRGVNWTCAMDVALRAVSWGAALSLMMEAIAEDVAFASRLYRALLAHGRFVAAHLEAAEPRGNHYFADLFGLLVVGDLLRGAQEAEEWFRFAATEIERENGRQTCDDGADFEASIPYHRLMTEMAALALVTLERRDVPAADLRRRVRRMAEYAAHYTKPDGLAPQIGDNDDGRAILLGEHGADRRDHRALLALAAGLFDEPALLALAGERFEAAFWIHGPERLRRLRDGARRLRPEVTSALFPDAGTVLLRGGDLYVHFEAGPVGLRGHGGHAHNDTLSIEVQAGGRDLIVDPGTGSYTHDLALRDRFRATAAHNTVRVDGEEINPLPDSPFQLPGADRPRIVRALLRGRFDLVEAFHAGYERLADPVRHRRIVLLKRGTRRLVIEDRLEGRATHRLEWFFHLAPGVEATVGDDGRTLTGRNSGQGFTLRLASGLPGAVLALEAGEFSPRYGLVVPARVAVCRFEGRLPIAARFVMAIEETR
jgi:hypothetical protein